MRSAPLERLDGVVHAGGGDGLTIGLRLLLARYRDPGARITCHLPWPAVWWPRACWWAALLIGYAALRGMPHWQSVPSTWDAVWHANEVRFILDTGQASSTHMGELRNVETHALLYYPSAFHALAAVFCQLTGAAPTTGYTLSSLAAAVLAVPGQRRGADVAAAARPQHRVAAAGRAAAAAAVLRRRSPRSPTSSSTPPRCPTWPAYGIAAPTFVLITSTLRHRDRIPRGGAGADRRVLGAHHRRNRRRAVPGGWWLLEALWHPVRGRLRRRGDAAAVAVPTGVDSVAAVPRRAPAGRHHRRACVPDLPEQEAGGLFDAVFQHSRHLNDFPDPICVGRRWPGSAG